MDPLFLLPPLVLTVVGAQLGHTVGRPLLRRWRSRRGFLRVPRVAIADLEDGMRVRVVGRVPGMPLQVARSFAGPELPSSFPRDELVVSAAFELPVLAYRSVVAERRGTQRNPSWHPMHAEGASTSFLLDDGTGVVRIAASVDPRLIAEPAREWVLGRGAPPTAGVARLFRGVSERRAIPWPEGSLRVRETLIFHFGVIAVAGVARRIDTTWREGDFRANARAFEIVPDPESGLWLTDDSALLR